MSLSSQRLMVAKVSSFFFYNILPRLPILFLYYIQFLYKKKIKYGIHPRNPAELKVVHRRVEIFKKKKTTQLVHCTSLAEDWPPTFCCRASNRKTASRHRTTRTSPSLNDALAIDANLLSNERLDQTTLVSH